MSLTEYRNTILRVVRLVYDILYVLTLAVFFLGMWVLHNALSALSDDS